MLRLAQWGAEPLSPGFGDPAVSGGIEVDCGIHECDLAAWLCGSPVVEAFARGAPTSSEIAAVGDVDSLAAVLMLAGGQPVSLDLARSPVHADLVRSEIVGERGSLICEAHGAGALLVRQEDGFREVLPPTDDVVLDALARQIDALAAAIAGGPVPDAARPSDAAAALRATLALQQSRQSGIAVGPRETCSVGGASSALGAAVPSTRQEAQMPDAAPSSPSPCARARASRSGSSASSSRSRPRPRRAAGASR